MTDRIVRGTIVALWAIAAHGSYAAEMPPSFAGEVAPILQKRCLGCHNDERRKGELSLAARDSILEGGSSGPAIVPRDSAKSLLATKVGRKEMPPKAPLTAAEVAVLRRWIDAGAPWEGGDLKVESSPSAPVRRAGLDWWSLQPVRRPALPVPADRDWVRNPIDAFIGSRLQTADLTPSAEADRRTYIRRVTLDLTGLLPTPEEVEAFIADPAPDAYERLVDGLLSSPAYGETWARHWLDVIRFAESHGYEMNTLRTNAWPYRDYVIRALNHDIPFKQFVTEQLAGDTLPNADALTQAATGFLVSGPHDMVGNATIEGKLQQRADDLFDMTATTGSAFLGLTVGCARCHDHKFDRISQKDFYRLEAVFAGIDHAERPMPEGNSDARRGELARLRQELERIDVQIDEHTPLASAEPKPAARPPVHARRNVERFAEVEARFIRFTVLATNDGIEPCIDELEVYTADAAAGNVALASNKAKASASSEYPNAAIHKIPHLIDGLHGNGRSWISNEPGRGWAQVEFQQIMRISRVVWGRDREQKYRDRLATDYRIEVSRDGKEWTPVAGSWDRRPYSKATQSDSSAGPDAALIARRAEIEARISTLEKPPTMYAGAFHKADATYVLKRGDPMQKLEEVGPGSLTGIGKPFALKPAAAESERRRTLAEWITDFSNPLPARVMVNRIWHYHFGQGIVRTPSDFGFNGDRPSHPELLDWLAAEFQAGGGRLKPIHRLIVLSNTYRQASQIDTEKAQRDADNRLLWRFPSRRLDAEQVRDTMLQVSGSLNRQAGGPGYHLWNYSGYVIVFTPKPKLGPDEFRRMIYQFKPRTQQDGTFGIFDCPDATAVAPRRTVSTTPLQALNLLNDGFVHDQSDYFAKRIARRSDSTVEQVREAFALAFGREPSEREADAATKLAERHGLPALSRALFNANEFVMME